MVGNRRQIRTAPCRPLAAPRRAASTAATLIFLISIIASNARFASSPPAARASTNTRGVICQEIPFVLAPTACAFFAAIADDGVAVAVGLLLIVDCDLEREGFAMSKWRPAIEAAARLADVSRTWNAAARPEGLPTTIARSWRAASGPPRSRPDANGKRGLGRPFLQLFSAYFRRLGIGSSGAGNLS